MLSSILNYYFLSNVFYHITCLNDLASLFYFTDPGSVFFTNITIFHDEVCFYLLFIIILKYGMLYSILSDHIYITTDIDDELSQTELVFNFQLTYIIYIFLPILN